MTGREFTESGLHKLTDEELAALNAWVRNRSLAGSDNEELQRALSEAAELEQALARAEADDHGADLALKREEFTTTIVGDFSGWSGYTEFELANGMVWQQIGSDTLRARRMENPEVTLRPGMFGSWFLKVEGYNQSTRVRRVR